MASLDGLARILRELRRRHARQHGGAQLSYRDIAVLTGWSHGVVGDYLVGRVLPPTDRFDDLIRLFGATPAEQGALATARDSVEEQRRHTLPTGRRVAEIPVPRQLPADVFGFTGRVEQLAELDVLADASRPGAGLTISVVSGTAGVGKTALAVRWGHRAADRFPGGHLYVDLRGYGPDAPLPAADALAGFLRGLGVAGADVPDDLAERAACYRSLLAGRRVLIVLDNASSAEQVRPLLPGTLGCVVVVTSRDDLSGLVARDGARRIDLDSLSEPEAVTLLRTLIGARADAERAATVELARACVHLPLALRVAAERATANATTSLAELLAELSGERRRLDLLGAAGDPRTAVRTVFSWSYRHLSPAGGRAFGLLGLHPGRTIDAYVTAALADVSRDEAHALIDELTRAHLIEPVGPGTRVMHDLLRAYAVECAAETGDATERRAALSRLFDSLRHTASTAVDMLFPHDRRDRPRVAPVHTPTPPMSHPDQALQWLDLQMRNLVAVAGFAGRHGWEQHSVDLSRILWRHLEVGGHCQEALALHTAAARAASHLGHGGPDVLTNLGNVHWWMGSYREAQGCFERSIATHREIGDGDGEARASARLGLVHERLGDYGAAVACLQGALARYRRSGNRHGEGAQLVNLGAVQRRLGRYSEAAAHQRAAAAIFRQLGDDRLHGYALGNLGAVESLLGRQAEAVDHLEQALAYCRESHDRGGEAGALAALGAVHSRSGRFADALDHLHRALRISRDTADRSVETETLNTLGDTLRAMRQREPALARHRAALTLTRQTGDRFEHARALHGIAQTLRALGQGVRAERYRRRASAIYTSLRVPEADQVRIQPAGPHTRAIHRLDVAATPVIEAHPRPSGR